MKANRGVTLIFRQRENVATALLVIGSGIVLCSTFFLSETRQTWATVAGAVVSLGGLLFRTQDSKPSEPEDERTAFEEWRSMQSRLLEQQATRLQEQQREIVTQLSRVQEVLEYPVFDQPGVQTEQELVRLSEQDRQVHAILEEEAGRVYEKIRANGYSASGKIDLEGIRAEINTLIQRVANVYSPGSANPLLETSFEQLARSASRICLHTLVLLEQLPLDVKSYNLRQMYGYVKKAVQGYGTYQQVAPWLKHLTRGAYVGRLAAGTNPVSLGAWWLATEVGRRGAQRFVENVVDRQAVAALNDIVAIIGVEVANVYGPGFRQRDAAWVMGAELTELLSRFPVSRESLQNGLNAVSALPLRSEYDRIYLYRCIAEHRPAGLRIADPAMLTRGEREQIAAQLEAFLSSSIHGIREEDRCAWQSDVESRLDLKLHLCTPVAATGNSDLARSAVRSVYNFLTSIAGADAEAAIAFIEIDELMTKVPVAERAPLLVELRQLDSSGQFEPPDLDPSANLTVVFLNTLMSGAILLGEGEQNINDLLVEIACYFRHNRDAAQQMLESALRKHVQKRCEGDVSLRKLDDRTLRVLWKSMNGDERIIGFFTDLATQSGSSEIDLQHAVLFSIRNVETNHFRLMLIQGDLVLWSADSWDCKRHKGLLIDDCRLTGGFWSGPPRADIDSLVVGASITGGGYSRYFASLLQGQVSDEQTPG